jgi:type IV pilus assembly protein PilQ
MWPRLHQRDTTRLLTGLAAVLVLALVPVTPALPQTDAVRITQVSVKGFGDTVQLSVIGTGPLTYRTLQLSSPPRLVIDLPGALVDAGIAPLIDVQRGGVARVRVGQFQTKPAIARIAVDMDRVLPFTLATSTPAVLVAKFAARGDMAAVPSPAARPAAPAVVAPAPPVAQAPAPPALPVVQAQAPAPPPPAPAVVAQAPVARVNLEFRSAEIADVLSALAKVCNLNIVTDASVKGAITVRLVDLSCDEAFKFILDANGLGFRRIGRNLIVMAAEKLAPPPELPEVIIYPLNFGTATQDLADRIQRSIPGSRVTFDARTNTLIVVGTSAQHEDVRKMLASLDIQLTQVMLEIRVVEVSVSALRELGLNWGLTGDTAPNIINIQGTFPNQIVLGIATFDIFGRLNALISDSKARVITAPRVAVLDANEAEIRLSEDIPIPQTDASGRTTFAFKSVGVILKITPKVNAGGFLTTRVEPEVSTVTRLVQSGGFQVPIVASRKATTIVNTRSGESFAIGGLISTEERRRTIKVPFLGDIPLIGQLFRTVSNERVETEVIFILTVQIVPPSGGAPAPTPRP